MTRIYSKQDLVVKTLIVASPEVSHAYRMCRPNSKNSKLESVCFEGLSSSNNYISKSSNLPNTSLYLLLIVYFKI